VALEELEAVEPRAARVAKLRLLWGLDHDEVAGVLACSRSTVDRNWRIARRWLAARL
jgi:DNA-directed RNA polymerase specialized sigma24 family protein